MYAQSITHGGNLNVDINLSNHFKINSIYPNPFNPKVNIDFFNPKNDQVSVKVYDLNGRLVSTIHEGLLNHGNYNFTWDANHFSSGLYIVSIQSTTSSINSKISLLK
jgi:hypothetical protein